MTVVYLPGGNDVRVAYAIGRKVGPAVVRNRVRRRSPRGGPRARPHHRGRAGVRRLSRDRAAGVGRMHI